ncbi:hypothetical protein BSKO_08726 [Bryopsis sp. KO-2023]|nr:hypothetical protein BSKO_08726 [Bryopsis sp. KO-2023]
MEAESTRSEAYVQAEEVAQKMLDIVQAKLPDNAVSKIKEQQQLFLSQLSERDRLTKVQEQHAGIEAAKPEEFLATKENEDVFSLSDHVESRLREFFSVTDSFNEQEAQVLAEKLGISRGVVLDFFHRNRSQVEEVLESARLKYLTKAKAPSKRNSTTTTTTTEVAPVDPPPVAEPIQDDSQMDVDISSDSESDQDSDSPPRKAAKLENLTSAKKRERAATSKVVGAKRHRQKSGPSEKSGSEAETESLPEQQEISPEDSEKLRLLDGLKSASGGLADTTAAGSMLLVMREESSFLVREALLNIILRTEGEMLLERLVGSNIIFCKVMEAWINEGTKKKKTEFLKQIVEVLGRVPFKADHIKSSRLQTLVTRLSNKYNDRELNLSATELVTQFQRLRQGLPPQGQGKNRGLGTVLERLQSGEAKQKGKVFFLPSDALKRPTKKKPTMKQRPLTTSEIIEKQQRLRYLTQAGYSMSEVAGRSSEPSDDRQAQQKGTRQPQRSSQASDLDDLPPEALEALRKHREEKKRKQEQEKANQAAAAQQRSVDAVRPPSNLSPMGFGQIVRCMREAPSDPNFYIQQQQAYLAARRVRIREEKAVAEQDSIRASGMRGRGNWIRPPLVDSACDSLALGEASTETRTLSEREMSISPVVPAPGEPPREPGLMPAADNVRPRELPFAPTNRQEFDDQRQKLLSKGVRKHELVCLPVQANVGQTQQIHQPITHQMPPQQPSIAQPISPQQIPAQHFPVQQQFTVQQVPAGVAGGYGHMSGQVQNPRVSPARGTYGTQGFGTSYSGRNPGRNQSQNRGRGRGGGGGRQGSHAWRGGHSGSGANRGQRGGNRGRGNRGRGGSGYGGRTY